MSQPEPKRVKTDEPAYELIYWPGIPGRGEIIRVLFEEAGVPYKDIAKEQDEGAAISTVLALPDADARHPVFACPALRHGDLVLSQTANILLYLAPKLGLAPSEVGSSAATFELNQIVMTILNAFVDEVHDTHHPIAVSLHYEDQKPEALRRGKAFVEERLPKFLAYLQRVVDANSETEEPWLYGSALTYADLVLFQVFVTLFGGRGTECEHC